MVADVGEAVEWAVVATSCRSPTSDVMPVCWAASMLMALGWPADADPLGWPDAPESPFFGKCSILQFLFHFCFRTTVAAAVDPAVAVGVVTTG